MIFLRSCQNVPPVLIAVNRENTANCFINLDQPGHVHDVKLRSTLLPYTAARIFATSNSKLTQLFEIFEYLPSPIYILTLLTERR